MEMTKGRINFIYDPRDMLLSLQSRFDFVRAVILENISGFEPSIQTIVSRYFEACDSTQILPFYPALPLDASTLFVISPLLYFVQALSRLTTRVSRP